MTGDRAVPASFAARAAATAAAIDARLWDQDRSLYVDYDLGAGETIPVPALAGFAPLFAGIPDPARARKMVAYLGSPSFSLDLEDGTGFPAASYDRFAPGYSPRRYWRGPVWIQMDWLIMHGLRKYGYLDQTARLGSSIIDLPALSGFREYFDPETRADHGAEDFSWTAALLIDLLHDDP